jgi:hypothetical protein
LNVSEVTIYSRIKKLVVSNAVRSLRGVVIDRAWHTAERNLENEDPQIQLKATDILLRYGGGPEGLSPHQKVDLGTTSENPVHRIPYRKIDDPDRQIPPGTKLLVPEPMDDRDWERTAKKYYSERAKQQDDEPQQDFEDYSELDFEKDGR